jgi:hypothetical protein
MGRAVGSVVVLMAALGAMAGAQGQSASLVSAEGKNGVRASLAGAYYLAKCVESRWRDAESVRFLIESEGNEERRAFYLTAWMAESILAMREATAAGSSDQATKTAKRAADEAAVAVDALKERVLLPWATWVGSATSTERGVVAQCLGTLASNEDAVNMLILLLNDSSSEVRVLTSQGLALAKPTPAARRAIPFLAVHLFLDPDVSARRYSALAIGNLAGEVFPTDGGPTDGTIAAAKDWIERRYDTSILQRRAAPAAGMGDRTDGTKPTLEEAYWLAKCASEHWRDNESFARLIDASQNRGLRAHYLLTLLCHVHKFRAKPVALLA